MFYDESYVVLTQKEAGPKVETVKATERQIQMATFIWQEILANSRVHEVSVFCMHAQAACTSHLPLNGKTT